MPFDVPMTIVADTARQVGEPKFLLPASEKACPFSLFSFVHRTTSQGGDGVSVSPGSSTNWLVADTVRLCPPIKAGELGLDEEMLGEEIRDWNLLSKGRKEGVGLLMPGRDLCPPSTLLLGGDETADPCYGQLLSSIPVLSFSAPV